MTEHATVSWTVVRRIGINCDKSLLRHPFWKRRCASNLRWGRRTAYADKTELGKSLPTTRRSDTDKGGSNTSARDAVRSCSSL